ncbi:amidase [Bacillus sp. MUM 116]|uniref:amidase family protein n=1 Tax=Bacillus sp. MUM 116 TaxID=1678002 RepID=UPI0008F5B3AD|nr:amidase family protein [Bacillus sp. MUM 116]OIK11214.1 amidase [Bacillus sp. MUM 116]
MSTIQKTFNVLEKTIEELQEALTTGEITSVELVQIYLDRITAYDKSGPNLKSIIGVNENALVEAAQIDKERIEGNLRGPLHGIPIILKDNFDTADMPTTGGATILKDFVPTKDAFVVKKLREAGAIIIAKSNLGELAMLPQNYSSLGGQTLNPYDLTRTPGSSSGGTGASIASNFATAGMGTDGVNSIRSPGSANSLVGFRPTKGLLSREGIIPATITQETVGPITRTVQDAAIMLDVLAGYNPNDSTTAWNVNHIPATYTEFLQKDGLKGKRLGVLKTLFGSDSEHQEVNSIMEKAIEDLKNNGAEIVYLDIPELDTNRVLEKDVTVYEFKTLFNSYLEGHSTSSSIKSLKELIDSKTYDKRIETFLLDTQALENPLEETQYKERLLYGLELKNTVIKSMADNNLHAIVYPHQKQLVAKVGEPQAGRNGIIGAITGFPAITVPAGFSRPTLTAPIGVPIGIEFLGRPWSEPILIEIAYSYEQATHHRRPPIVTPEL